MDGLTTGLAEVIAEGIGKAAPKLAEPVSDLFSNFSDIAGRSPAGVELRGVIKNDLEPLQAKEATKMGQQAVAHYKQTGNYLYTPAEIREQSFNTAKDQTLGPHHGIVVNYLNHAAKTNGPEYAQQLANALHVYLQDTTTSNGAKVSAMKQDVRFSKQLGPEFFKSVQVPGQEEPKLINTFDRTAIYKPQTEWERGWRNYFSVMQLPFLALKHASTTANNLVAPLEAFTKGLADMTPANYQATRNMVMDTGALMDTVNSSYRDLFYYKNGMVAKTTGSPKLGYLLGKAIHYPGFQPIRDLTLVFSGAVGKHEAEYFGRRIAAKPGDILARQRLEQLGLDPAAIAQRGGTITPQEMETAVYKAVDNRAFLFSRAERSPTFQSTPMLRLASLYHNYVNRQAAFIVRELKTAAIAHPLQKGGDFVHAMKIMGILGVAFPAIGSLEEMLEDYTMFKNGYKNTKDRYKVLFGSEGLFKAFEQYLDFYSHIGGLGLITSYSRGLLRHQLASLISGPVMGTIYSDAEDLAIAGHQTVAGQKGATFDTWKQPIRDVVEQAFPIVGRPAAHEFLPTKAEEKSRWMAAHPGTPWKFHNFGKPKKWKIKPLIPK